MFPSSLESIEVAAFQYCHGLTQISIPDSVGSIGTYAFNNCSGLTQINFPVSLKSIGISAFGGCSGLTTINYEGDAAQWNKIELGNGNDPIGHARKNFNQYWEVLD